MKAYVILPIYNIEVSKDVIDKDIVDGYRIISNELFFEKYEKQVIYNHNTYFANAIKDDIQIPFEGMLVTRPLAKYMIIKEYEVENDYNDTFFQYFRNEERGFLNNLLLSLRLTQKGRCQVNRCYLFSKNTQGNIAIDFSTNLENMYGWISTRENLYEDTYEFTANTVQKLKNTCLIIRPNSNNALVPIDYFMQYYNITSTYDRIIKLAIVLESSVLAGLEQELNYRLKIRICAFLKQDYKKMIDIFYRLRSNIVHNGFIDKDSFKALRKFLKDKEYSDIKAIFIFINDYIEPLVREILYKSFEIFANNDKIKTYNDLFTNVDNEIIEKIMQ